jgi:hypothetical protein
VTLMFVGHTVIESGSKKRMGQSFINFCGLSK